MLLLRIALKSTLVGGFVYCVYYEVLQPNSKEIVKLSAKVRNSISPYIEDHVPKNITETISQIPANARGLSICAKRNWNNGVMTTMNFISDLPNHSVNAACSLYETVEKYMTEPKK